MIHFMSQKLLQRLLIIVDTVYLLISQTSFKKLAFILPQDLHVMHDE